MTNSFTDEYKDGMKPKYRTGVLGAPLSIQSANQIQDMGVRLNEGMKNIEISAISPEIADGIPREHFEEMRRLGKLTDSKVSLHAPIIDASGFTQQGWSEQNRVAAEKQFNSIIDNAQLLDDSGNVPVVIHGANMFGSDWDKSIQENYKEELKKEFEGRGQKVPEKMPRTMTVVDQITGQVVPLEFKKKYLIGEEKEEIWTPQRQLESLNSTHWDQEKLKVFSQMKEIMEVGARQSVVGQELAPYKVLEKNNHLKTEEIPKMQELEHTYQTMNSHINTVNQHINSSIQDMYNTYVRCVNKDKLPDYQKERFEKEKQHLKIIGDEIKKEDKEWENFVENWRNKKISEDELNNKRHAYINKRSELMTKALSEMEISPDLFKPVNEFSKDKASDTFSNIAFNAYKKFKDKTPIIAVENSYAHMPLSTGKELREAVELSRKKFADRLVKEQNVDSEEAKKIASKIIGATWDVGHINLLRKGGYSEEEIANEAKEVAKLVKHIHLTDNFGYNDTHLPPGMGNVPIKKTLEILEKEGNLEGVRQIIEAGNFVQNFKESPYPYALESLGSPIYSVGGAPYWTETRPKQAPDYYNMGFGEILPEYHFKQFYGGGWAAVPRELGGEKGGGSEKGRFAGGGE